MYIHMYACRSCEATNSSTSPSVRHGQIRRIDRVTFFELLPRSLYCFIGVKSKQRKTTLHAVHIQSGCSSTIGRAHAASMSYLTHFTTQSYACLQLFVCHGSPAQLDRCLAYMAEQTTLVGNNLHSLLIVSNVTHHSQSVTLRDNVCTAGQNENSVLALGYTHARHSESSIWCAWRPSPSHD